jgi:uncharacterized alkaline shock family protein YloU
MRDELLDSDDDAGPEEWDGGTLTVSPDVIRNIASQEAARVDGIVGLEDTLMHDILSLVRGGDQSRGVSVEMGEGEVTVGLRISVRYGVRIPDLILELRGRIVESVAQMTGFRVLAVNVTVSRIFLVQAKPQETAETDSADSVPADGGAAEG